MDTVEKFFKLTIEKNSFKQRKKALYLLINNTAISSWVNNLNKIIFHMIGSESWYFMVFIAWFIFQSQFGFGHRSF